MRSQSKKHQDSQPLAAQHLLAYAKHHLQPIRVSRCPESPTPQPVPVLDLAQITICPRFNSDLHFCSKIPVLAGVETLSEPGASDVSLLTLSCGILGPLSLLAPAQGLAASDACAHECPIVLLASLAQQCSLRPCPDLVPLASLLPLPVPAMTPPMMSVAVEDVTTMLAHFRAAAQPVDVNCSPLPPSLQALPAQQELRLFEALCQPAALATRQR